MDVGNKSLVAGVIVAGLIVGIGVFRNQSMSSKAVSDAIESRTRLPSVIHFTPIVREGCMIGDGNVIELHASQLEVSDLLITVEEIGSGKVLAKTTAPASYFSRANSRMLDLSLDKSQVADGFAGIFVCSDRAASGSCQQKRPLDMVRESARISDSLLRAPRRPRKLPEKAKRDAIFFFQLLEVSGNALVAITPKTEGGIDSMLAKRIKSESVRAAVSNLVKRATSSPVHFVDNNGTADAMVRIPKFSHAVCEREQQDEIKRRSEFMRRRSQPYK